MGMFMVVPYGNTVTRSEDMLAGDQGASASRTLLQCLQILEVRVWLATELGKHCFESCRKEEFSAELWAVVYYDSDSFVD